MTDLIADAADRLSALLAEASGGIPLRGSCSVSRVPARGDLVCTHALRSAPAFGLSPQALAELLLSRLDTKDPCFARAEAVSGFMNFRLGEPFFRGLYASCRALTPDDLRAALGGVPLPEKPFLFFSSALRVPEPFPELSELRRDGGSPFYHLLYTAQRCSRLAARFSGPCEAFVPPEEDRALLLALGRLPSELSRCAGSGSLSPLCRYLYALSCSARALYPSLCRRGADARLTILCTAAVLSAAAKLFTDANAPV